jgi:hypothetical protein
MTSTDNMNHQENKTVVSFRYKALFLDVRRDEIDMDAAVTPDAAAFVRELADCGIATSEELLRALSMVPRQFLESLSEILKTVMGINLNWMPLVKGWDTPTGEGLKDHLITFIANIFGEEAGFKGERLECGHLIPEHTFPLERYNGCPFCGRPFTTASHIHKGQNDQLEVFRLFTDEDLKDVLKELLSSPTPLDGTQTDSLRLLLRCYDLPEDTTTTMKETAIEVIDILVEQGDDDKAARLMKTPMDILRYLWYKKTGRARIIEPNILIDISRRNSVHIVSYLDRSEYAAEKKRNNLRLKYSREWCRRVAKWLNAMPLTACQAAENMNPKRGMWARMIRALRLGEFSRKRGYSHLAEIISTFYNQDYTTWQGMVDKARAEKDMARTLALLKERPGAFARQLFSVMLLFGAEPVLEAFDEVTDKLPTRLLVSLTNTAERYFDYDYQGSAHPITGGVVSLKAHPLILKYSEEELRGMATSVNGIYLKAMARRFAAKATGNKTIYIDPALYRFPVCVGDRGETVQTFSSTQMGMRFPVQGETVRLFMQWGVGLHAQHLDMDLGCRVVMKDGKYEDCAFYHLTCTGCMHSGDIREIPEMVGTAEYIELSLPDLRMADAKYVIFSCNAYSNGALSPNLTVGWMNCKHDMTISEDGVAYDPSCVQHMVRVGDKDLAKGIVFGVLDVVSSEIVWLETPNSDQVLSWINHEDVINFMLALDQKMKIGEVLDIKANAQGLTKVDSPEEADEAYTSEWALDPAKVSLLLLT